MGVVKEIYSKCKDDFLLGLLVHRSTPLLYPNTKSPAELFLGRKIATNIPYIPFGTAALMQCLRSDDHDQKCRFNPNDGDSCYVRINPNENVWEKGLVVSDKVWMYEEIMMNNDNLESNLLTSSLLKIHSLYKFCYMLSQTSVKR